MKDKKRLLFWTCGLGKSYMSLFIAKKINASSILICVPTKYLANQFVKSVKNIFDINPIVKYSDGDTINDVIKLLNSDKSHKIIISTYQSSKKILDLDYKFNFKIGDEAHHLVTSKKEIHKNTFDKFHNIRSEYELYMTATPKILDDNNSKSIYDMNDEKHFGKLIDEKSIKWAIDNKKITDYNIINVICSSYSLRKIINKIDLKTICKNIEDTKTHYELFFSAYVALKALSEKNKTHLLIYLNKQENASIVKQIIDRLLEEKVIGFDDEIYNQVLTSKSKDSEGNKLNIFNNDKSNCEISKFTNSKYGIISCVYIFGEGVDLPKLNGVVIGEKMQTEIRIVQSCLRGNRLENNNLTKKASIIIPTTIDDSYNKLKNVLKLMASSDESIEQKLEVYTLEDKNKYEKKDEKEVEIKLKFDKHELKNLKLELNEKGYFGIYDIKKEYEYYRNFYQEYNFTSVTEFFNTDVFRKSNDRLYYENHFGKNFSWIDFLNIDTSKWIQTKEEWKEYCKENNIKTTEEYYNEQKINKKLPFEPKLIYDNFKGVSKELFYKKKFKYIKK
jgi:superfamily II DNA or RNA helicase